MTEINELVQRNAGFAESTFEPGQTLTTSPSGNMMVIGCLDPRVDPAHILGIKNDEAAVIRNVGGRITPATLRTLRMLTKVAAANASGRRTSAWNLVVVHHTDCGMTDLAPFEDLLAEYFEIPEEELAGKSVSDPYGSVQVDVDIIHKEIRSPNYFVTGMVYDVATGLVDIVVPPAQVPTG